MGADLGDFPISDFSLFCEKRLEGMLKDIFEEHHDFFVYEVRKYMLKCNVQQVVGEEREWQGIESLSKLRALVGGRFQNLKERWVNAGLPLKEHRGEALESYEINQEGWVEMRNWLFKQGYDVRLADESTGFVFEISKH